MQGTHDTLTRLARESADRGALWTGFIQDLGIEVVAEIGVYRGHFAERLLTACPQIKTYYLVDPWRHLDGWNKPANRSDKVFESYLAETLDRTDAQAEKRVVLRGKTTEVVDEIADESLDFAYVDGDHTLKGVSIDLIALFPKVKVGGFLAGDDFCRSIWQHEEQFEPTLVFPFSVYFAEAVGSRIYALPHRQMLIEKGATGGFEFVDLTGSYGALDLRSQVDPRRSGQPSGGVAPQPTSRPPRAQPSLARRLRRRMSGGLR